MNVTRITVTPVHNKSRIKASVVVVFDDVFKVRGIKILPRTKEKGLFVAFPESKTQRGDYFALAYPISKEYRKQLEDQILCEYDKALENEENYLTGESNDSSALEQEPDNSEQSTEGYSDSSQPIDEPDNK